MAEKQASYMYILMLILRCAACRWLAQGVPCATGAVRSTPSRGGNRQVGERLERERPGHSAPAHPHR